MAPSGFGILAKLAILFPLAIFLLLPATKCQLNWEDYSAANSTQLQDVACQLVQQVKSAVEDANVGLLRGLGAIGKHIAKQINMKANNYTCDPIRLHNWGSTFLYSTQDIQYPQTTEDVQKIVTHAVKLRPLGTRHAFTTIADTPHTMLATLGLNSILSVNTTVPSVTVQGGITYTDLCPFLDSIGFALPNLAALAEVSIAGATQTGTHGSGLAHQCLASQLRSMQLVLANGTVATYQQGDPEWNALAISLGAFGVITQMELNLVPSYKVTPYVFLNMPMENVIANFDTIENMGYSVQLFSAMSNPNSMDQIWINVKTGEDNSNVGNLTELFGAVKAPMQVSPISVLPATYLVEQGVEQPWYYGLIDYHLGLSGMDGDEIQAEYFVPYKNATAALQAINAMSAVISPILYVMFMRTIKADDFWMSENSGGDAHVSIHFTFQPNMPAVLEVLPQIEQALLPFGARPHWGKFFTMKPADFLPSYPNLEAWKQLAYKLDPCGKFRNDFLNENVFINLNGTTAEQPSSAECNGIGGSSSINLDIDIDLDINLF